MRKIKEKEIGGVQWRTKMLPVGEGINVSAQAGRVVAVAIEKGYGAATKGEGALDADATSIAKAISGVLDYIGPDELPTFAKRLLQCTDMKEGDEWLPLSECFDDAFAGAYKMLFEVCAWVFKVNFEDVFSFASIAKDKVAALAKKASP